MQFIFTDLEVIGYQRFQYRAFITFGKENNPDIEIEVKNIKSETEEIRKALDGKKIKITIEEDSKLKTISNPSDDHKDELRRDAEDMRKEIMNGKEE